MTEDMKVGNRTKIWGFGDQEYKIQNITTIDGVKVVGVVSSVGDDDDLYYLDNFPQSVLIDIKDNINPDILSTYAPDYFDYNTLEVIKNAYDIIAFADKGLLEYDTSIFDNLFSTLRYHVNEVDI